jgi:hypothetical protein
MAAADGPSQRVIKAMESLRNRFRLKFTPQEPLRY